MDSKVCVAGRMVELCECQVCDRPSGSLLRSSLVLELRIRKPKLEPAEPGIHEELNSAYAVRRRKGVGFSGVCIQLCGVAAEQLLHLTAA